jgi:hypothetical protein
MPPPDFAGGPAASVDLGDGGAHDPQIRFTADDNSCRWNGFPVCIDAERFQAIVPSVAGPTYGSFDTDDASGGTKVATELQWPYLRVYDFAMGVLSGYKLQIKMTGTVVNHGTSAGSLATTSQFGGPCTAEAGPIIGAYDSGFLDQNCGSCSTFGTANDIEIRMAATNFSPIVGHVTVSGKVEAQWVFDGVHSADWMPQQQYEIIFVPPGCVAQSSADLDPGLYINLPTDACGVLSKTYQQIADDVNALNLGITATILGSHGSDIAKPDPSCPAPFYCCDMAGAECSGSIHYP